MTDPTTADEPCCACGQMFTGTSIYLGGLRYHPQCIPSYGESTLTTPQTEGAAARTTRSTGEE